MKERTDVHGRKEEPVQKKSKRKSGREQRARALQRKVFTAEVEESELKEIWSKDFNATQH